MKILEITNNYKKVIEETAKVILAGGLVVFPSDTVYGLLVDATNQKAVKELLSFKDRWTGKAISVAISDLKMAKEYVIIGKNEQNIYSKLLPGPFTMVSNGKHRVAPGIEAENGTLGIRIPNYKAINDLVKLVDRPITVTSANLSGRRPHYSIKSFLKTLSEKKKKVIDLIVDGGKLPKNKPSTVIDITNSEIKILRRGDLITGEKETFISKSEKETEKIAEFLFKKINKKNKPIVFALSGDLGTGKTVFSKRIGKLTRVKEKIVSPTFVICNEYKINGGKFLHADLYKITTERDLEEIKFLELFDNKNTIACVEWIENMGEKNLEELKTKTDLITVTFKYKTANTREIEYNLNKV